MNGGYLVSVRLRRELPEGSYLRGLGPVRYLMEGGVLEFDRPVTFLVGENGTGKSTLLEGVRPVEYRETEHYQLTKRFLDDPERMLRYLLGD